MEEETNQTPKEIKAILLGNSGVGKTNLINTSVGKKFEEGYNITLNISFCQKSYEIDGEQYSVNLWDSAGQEAYDSITKIFLKNAKIVIFVYDITDKASFDALEKWITYAKEVINNNYVSAILGNKVDLFINESVKEEDARNYAHSKGMKFQLVSAKENPKLFSIFLKELIQELKESSENEESKSIKLNTTNTQNRTHCIC